MCIRFHYGGWFEQLGRHLHYLGGGIAEAWIDVDKLLKALVWFWIIDEPLVLISILSVCRLNEVGTCQVMEQVMIMVMMVMTTR